MGFFPMGEGRIPGSKDPRGSRQGSRRTKAEFIQGTEGLGSGATRIPDSRGEVWGTSKGATSQGLHSTSGGTCRGQGSPGGASWEDGFQRTGTELPEDRDWGGVTEGRGYWVPGP